VRTFFEYLYRSGRVPAAALARAQVAQLRSLPSLLEIAESRGLLSPEELLRVIMLQEEKEVSFAQACRELGLYSAGLEETFRAELDAARVPLAELLASDASLPAGLITELLAGFRRGDALPPVAEAPAPAFSSPAPAPTFVDEAPAAPAAEGMLGEGIRATWGLLELLHSAPESETALALEAMHAFHRLKGTVRFEGPVNAERWADFGEQVFRLGTELKTKPNAELANAGRDALRAIAAEATPGAPALEAGRKEALVHLLKNLRQEFETRKNRKGESA